MVGELDRCWREGGEFDREVVGFEYWRRARGIENRPWGCVGDEAVRRCHVGEGVVWRVVEHHVVAVLALPTSSTTLARPARTRAPSLQWTRSW